MGNIFEVLWQGISIFFILAQNCPYSVIPIAPHRNNGLKIHGQSLQAIRKAGCTWFDELSMQPHKPPSPIFFAASLPA